MTNLWTWACVGLMISVGIMGALLKQSWTKQGELEIQIVSQRAVIAQREADIQVNARAVAQLSEKLLATDTKVVTVTEKVYVAPRTTACVEQPSVRIAIDGVRDLYGDSLRAPDRRQPQGPLQTAQPAARTPQR